MLKGEQVKRDKKTIGIDSQKRFDNMTMTKVIQLTRYNDIDDTVAE